MVSVLVVTYNSVSFVAETLESVFKQSWKEIELIITDDCSQDDTVAVCRGWLKKNEHRFIRTVLIETESNSGVPTNINRGVAVARGDWLSFLAGDDTMRPRCIEDNMLWVSSHIEIRVLFSSVGIYNNTFEPQNLMKITPDNPYGSAGLMSPERNALSQYKMLLTSDRIHYTPSLFLHRETLQSLGGFDERFRLLEDYPLWLNLTRNGIKLFFMDKVTVNYRMHAKAINNTGSTFLINPNYFKQEKFRQIYVYPNLPLDLRLSARFKWIASQVFRWDCLNKQLKANRHLYDLLTVFLNPFMYSIWLKKRLSSKIRSNEFYL